MAQALNVARPYTNLKSYLDYKKRGIDVLRAHEKEIAKLGEEAPADADPPYAGRHVDYFNSWTLDDELDLATLLRDARCKFILSTWHSNQFRENELIKNWLQSRFHLFTRKHFYHIGSTEELRQPMIEALITNFASTSYAVDRNAAEQLAFLEEPCRMPSPLRADLRARSRQPPARISTTPDARHRNMLPWIQRQASRHKFLPGLRRIRTPRHS